MQKPTMNPNIEILPNGVAAVKGDSHHGVWCRSQGLVHDPWMAQQIMTLITKHKVTHAIDGGANIGTLTRPMLDAGASVLAFEPNPDAADCLAVNCPGAHIERKGLGSIAGHATLLRRDANVGASHIGYPDQSDANVINDVLVEIVTIDSYIAGGPTYGGRPLPGLIKLDIEGFELGGLRGAKETIARGRPVIIAEINAGALARQNATPQDIFAFLAAYGYKWRIMQSDCKPGDPQYDIVALPK